MKSIPSWLLTLVKGGVAVLLIVWLFRRGVLNLDALMTAASHWPLLILIAVIFYTQLILISLRWNLLLHSQGIPFRFRDAFSLTMIGILFNLIMPSSVGGDVMKTYLLHQRAGDRRAEAMATIVLDRVIGLLALLVVAACAALPSLLAFGSNLQLRSLAIASVVGAIAGLSALAIAVRFSSSSEQVRANRVVAFAVRAFGSLAEYRKRPWPLMAAMGLSMASYVLACAAFYCAAIAIGAPHFPLSNLFLVPLGIATTALPISPAGIGVGQVAFQELFRISSGGAYTFGANAFTVFQTMQFMVSLTGFFFYLPYKTPAVR